MRLQCKEAVTCKLLLDDLNVNKRLCVNHRIKDHSLQEFGILQVDQRIQP